jgi:hypothetical protein
VVYSLCTFSIKMTLPCLISVSIYTQARSI